MNTQSVALPPWAELLRDRYVAGEAMVFVLHGNVFDRYAVGTEHLALPGVLERLLERKSSVLELSLAHGVRPLRHSNPALASLEGVQEKGLGGALQYLETAMLSRSNLALIVPYAETLFPAAETHFLSFDERAASTTLHRWSLDDKLAHTDSIVILVTESLTALAPALLSNPRVVAINVELPDATERLAAVQAFAPSLGAGTWRKVAEQTAGLRLVQIAAIIGEGAPTEALSETLRHTLIRELLGDSAEAERRAKEFATLTHGMTAAAIRALIAPGSTATGDNPNKELEAIALIRQRKREILEKECAGLIEFIEPKHGLEVVGGNAAIKTELMRVAHALREGDTRRAPMGLLAVGPMGAGKTFVIKAFLKEAGLNGVALKNFRSQWVGATEANLERVLAMVKAMGPVALIIDEGDRSFGSRSEDNDGGTSSRVIARLKAFMSETENRGRVLFILMTNRPDKLDIDIKRPGRLDIKLPFFYAQSDAERAGIVLALLARHGLQWQADEPAALEQCCAALAGYSNADIEALVLLAANTLASGQSTLGIKEFSAACADFIPPQDREMVRYMELLAAQECSRRSWLPEYLKDMDGAALQSELRQLKLKLD